CSGYVPAPYTRFEGVRCLPPGHRLLLRRGRAPEVATYWELPRAAGEALLVDEEEATAQFRALLAESVADQMISDVPIGAFLSGGIDSTAVVWRMTETSRDSVRTFSVGFAERSYDETPWARRVARRFGSTHEEELITPKQVAAELTDILNIFDEPFADSSAIPLHFLARMTRAHGVTVALSGDGGDELFGGYETYFAGQVLDRFQRLPRWVQAVAAATVRAPPLSRPPRLPRQDAPRAEAQALQGPLWMAALGRACSLARDLLGRRAARSPRGRLGGSPARDGCRPPARGRPWQSARSGGGGHQRARLARHAPLSTCGHAGEGRPRHHGALTRGEGAAPRRAARGLRPPPAPPPQVARPHRQVAHAPSSAWRGRPRPPCTSQGRVQRPDAGMDSGAAAGAVPRRADVHGSAPGWPSSCQFCGASLRRARRAAS